MEGKEPLTSQNNEEDIASYGIGLVVSWNLVLAQIWFISVDIMQGGLLILLPFCGLGGVETLVITIINWHQDWVHSGIRYGLWITSHWDESQRFGRIRNL